MNKLMQDIMKRHNLRYALNAWCDKHNIAHQARTELFSILFPRPPLNKGDLK